MMPAPSAAAPMKSMCAAKAASGTPALERDFPVCARGRQRNVITSLAGRLPHGLTEGHKPMDRSTIIALLGVVISVISLSVSVIAFWFTWLRRGRLSMTKPTVIFFGYDTCLSSLQKSFCGRFSTALRQGAKLSRLCMSSSLKTVPSKLSVSGDMARPTNSLQAADFLSHKQGSH